MRSLLDRAEVRGPGECWPWMGTIRPDGYGVVWVARWRQDRAHRAVYEERVGPIPTGSVLRHSCDNPRCVNPAHLVPGSQAENMADMRSRGRGGPKSPATGERHGMAKLSASAVKAIRSSLAAGERCSSIALTHGVSVWTIQNIRRRRTWKESSP